MVSMLKYTETWSQAVILPRYLLLSTIFLKSYWISFCKAHPETGWIKFPSVVFVSMVCELFIFDFAAFTDLFGVNTYFFFFFTVQLYKSSHSGILSSLGLQLNHSSDPWCQAYTSSLKKLLFSVAGYRFASQGRQLSVTPQITCTDTR